MLTTPDLARLLAEHRSAATELASLLADADAVQWDAAPILRPRDEGGSGSGTISDPTSAVASDARRLAVRHRVEAAGDALTKSTQTLRAARANLARSLDEWAGHAGD